MDCDDDGTVADVSGGGAAVTAVDDSSDEGSCNPMVMTAKQDFQEDDMNQSTKPGDSSASRLRHYSSSRSDHKRFLVMFAVSRLKSEGVHCTYTFEPSEAIPQGVLFYVLKVCSCAKTKTKLKSKVFVNSQ